VTSGRVGRYASGVAIPRLQEPDDRGTRAIGISASFWSQIRCGMASVIAERIRPGWMALTRTPRWATSLAAALDRPTMPALAAE